MGILTNLIKRVLGSVLRRHPGTGVRPPSGEAAPQDADGAYRWALFQHIAGRMPEAETGYERALGLDPAHVLARGNLGSIRLARGDFSRETWSLYLANLERRGEDGRSSGLALWDGGNLRMKTILASPVNYIVFEIIKTQINSVGKPIHFFIWKPGLDIFHNSLSLTAYQT